MHTPRRTFVWRGKSDAAFHCCLRTFLNHLNRQRHRNGVHRPQHRAACQKVASAIGQGCFTNPICGALCSAMSTSHEGFHTGTHLIANTFHFVDSCFGGNDFTNHRPYFFGEFHPSAIEL